MSVLQTLIDRLYLCTRKFDELLELKKDNSSNIKEKENEIEELFSIIEKNQPDEITEYIERMHSSDEKEESQIMIDFKELEVTKKQILVKMMELIWKMGLFEDESDVAKREHWYNLLKANC